MTPHPPHLVALGSSFAAGPGIEPTEDAAAGRSARNYPHLLAARLGAELTDLTVSGATTATILAEPQRARGRRFPPQLAGVPVDADLVTVTAGGNDLGYLGGMFRAALAGSLERRAVTRPLGRLLGRRPPQPPTDEAVAAAVDGLAAIVAAVRLRAPGARVLLVEYLTIVGPDTRGGAALPLDPPTIAVFRETGLRLADAFAAAARRSGAELVAVAEASRDHALGSSEPWVGGYEGLRGSTFHPNLAGMTAVAGLVADVIG